MDVLTTSLEALIQRATNPQNVKTDTAAIVAFCVMLEKENDGVQIACKLLATYIQSTIEKQAFQSLVLLDTCMKKCGKQFHSEIGKFRFLNEMIKLVSPKYLGDKTPASVRDKVIEILYTWTRDYPTEVKIKEAYEMLIKQGVVKRDNPPIIEEKIQISKAQKAKNALFEDEETAKLLQELLQSKDPFELQLANRLIKSMVKDDERRIQQNSERNLELETVNNNVKVLTEILDSYNPEQSNTEDIELIKELYQSCERFKPIILKLADETQENDDTLGQILTVNDELEQVFIKYKNIFPTEKSLNTNKIKKNNQPSLLDLSSPFDISTTSTSSNNNNDNKKTDMEMLDDIFNSIDKTTTSEQQKIINNKDTNLLLNNINIMEPIKLNNSNKNNTNNDEKTNIEINKIDTKTKALDDLNEMGQSLLKKNLTCTVNNKNKNLIINNDDNNDCLKLNNDNNDVDILIGIDNIDNSNEDDLLIDAIDNVDVVLPICNDNIVDNNHDKLLNDVEIKPLTDINITIDDIKPSKIPPMTVIDNNGITVILHFTESLPRPDVTVIVITTMSKNSESLSNYLFQAVVTKKCKCRLQKPSGNELPAHNPFLPPSAITQIMLIANPLKVDVSLKFMLSYTMNDETYTEMGEVDKL
ncbi:hypothetical protein HCN44_007475 [Aphidius gifuensis]|uniref:ADP-ribosylation factor-binding protein GGA1 n=1 Tax=Aphidius gifuensis TaxID=684658 RepID=A0A835CQH0_APHGI|nr:ADP-ribosylation factor-binding protein GGA1 [Aphidius gifuensis]KAF7989165.1 hypothetical protein HCN44_007475 [Aphidius gifuensis]